MKLRKIVDNKKGSYADVFIFMIMAFIITVFFGLMYYGFTQVNTTLEGIEITFGDGQDYNNFTNIVNATWGEVYDSYGQLKTLTFVLIFGMIINILVANWLVKAHPIWVIPYIIVSLGAIVASAYISNTYADMLLNLDFGSTLQSFQASSYLLLYLPQLTAVVTLIGVLIMMIGMNKNKSLNDVPI